MTSPVSVDPPAPLPLPSPPPPTFLASRWTASHPSGQSLPLWEHDFITEMNCLIVKTQLPPFAGEGGALLDTGAWCGDPASGVNSPTVWKASHVTHQWTVPPPLSRGPSHSHTRQQCVEHLCAGFTICKQCTHSDQSCTSLRFQDFFWIWVYFLNLS